CLELIYPYLILRNFINILHSSRTVKSGVFFCSKILLKYSVKKSFIFFKPRSYLGLPSSVLPTAFI
ncbi:MAG: hypothetical protein AB8U62_07295, partial [Rickettsia aeschlimannii]